MAATNSPPPSPVSPRSSPSLIGYLRDDRVLQIIGQIVFALILIAALYGLTTSILNALVERNLTPNLVFLQNRAGFDISEKPEWYSANSTYWDAYTVGITNTLRVVVLGLVLSTLLGIFVGVALLSRNWLVRTIFTVYVELLRNTPLLVQLFAWYFVVMLSLPTFQQSLSFPQEGITVIPLRFLLYALGALLIWSTIRRLPSHYHDRRRVYVRGYAAVVIVIELVARLGIINGGGALRFEVLPWAYINIRGFAFPELVTTNRLAEWLTFVTVGAVLAGILWIYFGRLKETTGLVSPRGRYALAAIVLLALFGWLIVSGEPAPVSVPVVNAEGVTTMMNLNEARADGLITLQDEQIYATVPLILRLPEKNNFRFTSGTQITPEYMALLLGLVIYTSAFIAEIVRAGILAVPKGQVEAARALGFGYGDVLRFVILPQALRVIIPPLGNQYLNLAKNSSLAIAIAYADLFLITTTIMNQSGQSITGMAMVMLTYLIISLIIATLMDRANRRFQLITR